MVVKEKYIDAKTFCDFKKNQDKMIDVFNHSISELKESSKNTEKNVDLIANSVYKIEGRLDITSKVMWWVLGILATIFCSSIIANFI